MLKKTAVLIDGGFLCKKIPKDSDPAVQAARVVTVANRCLEAGEDLYRIFYYDCGPFDRTVTDLAGKRIDFRQTPQFAYQTSFLSHIAKQPFVAVRLGMLSYKGWVLKSHIARSVSRSGGAMATTLRDFVPGFEQKGVDMRIGLDIALLAMDKLVDRIILVTADSDFIPAMKLARREGLQIGLVSLANSAKPELLHHADFYRNPAITNI